MKKITNKTILKQGDKTFQPVEVDGVVYWHNSIHSVMGYTYFLDGTIGYISSSDRIFDYGYEIVAQSQPKLERVPIISLDSYVERLKKGIYESSKLATVTQEQFWIGKAAGFGEALQIYNKSNQNQYQYTQQDIEKAMNAARNIEVDIFRTLKYTFSNEAILEAINSISVIEVDEQFNILSYE